MRKAAQTKARKASADKRKHKGEGVGDDPTCPVSGSSSAAPLKGKEEAAGYQQHNLRSAEKSLEALCGYEEARLEFHASLVDARMAFIDAQRALRDNRSIDLSADLIPATQPLFASFRMHVVRGQEATGASPSDSTNTVGACDALSLEPVVDLVDLTSRARNSCEGSRSTSEKCGVESADKEASLQAVDPVFWFTLCPPRSLTEAQGKFRRALHVAVALANAQLRLQATI